MGVEDKYPGFTYHTYKENHPVHQFNSGKTNSHVRINGTVYIDTGEGPVPIEFDDYDKLNNDTFQNSMEPGLPNPFYLKDLDYDGEYPPTSNEYKAASKLLALVSEKGTMPCTWSLGGADGERIVFVEPTRVGSNKIKFNLGGYVYTMEVLADKVITTTKLIDEGSDDYDKLTNDIFQEFAESAGIPTPLGLKSFDFTNKHPDYSYEYKFASALKTKLENGEDLKCTWSVSGDDDESVIFVTPTLTDGCIKFTLGGNLYSMEFTNDNKVDCTTTPINEYKDYDVYSDEMFQEFAKTCGFTSDIQLKDLDFNNSYVPASKEYKLADTLMTILDGNLTAKCTWFISDEEYIFIEPTKYDDNIVAFTVGGTLYKFTKNSDGSKIIFSNEPINKASDDYDVFVDQEFKDLIDTVGVTLPHGLIDLNFDTTANVFSDEYKVADLIIDMLKAGDPVRCTWSVKPPEDKEYIFVDPTLYDDNTIHFVYGGNLYEMVTNPTTGVVTKTYPIKDSFKHESDYWMEAYEEITTTAPELKSLCAADGTYYEEGSDQYDILKILYDECTANGNMKALYSYVTLSDGTAERLMCDVTASVNNVLWISYGQDLIRAKFMDDDGNYILLNCYDAAEENDLYNNWFQKWYYEIDSDDHADQFFILNSLNMNKPKHYDKTTQEYLTVTKAFQAFSSREKEIVKFPVGLSTDFEGQNAIICVYAIYYSGVYGDGVVTEIDFEMGHYNYRLVWDMSEGYICLDRQNKYDSPEKQFDTYMNQAYKNGKCPTIDVEFSYDGSEIEVTSSRDINILNSLDDYAINRMSYTLGPYNCDNVILIPGGGVSFPSSTYGIDNKYQINNLYTNLLINCNFKDDTNRIYTWSVGDHIYIIRHDVLNDKWFTKWGTTSTPMYDSEAWYTFFNNNVLNNVRPGTLGSDLNQANAIKQDSSLWSVLEAIHTWYDSHALKPMDIPWTGGINAINGPRFTTSRLYPIDGYGSVTSHHRGLLIKRANTADLVIDYMEDDNGVPFYYVTHYNSILRDAMNNVASRSDANYLKPYYDVRRIAVSPLQVKETCFLGKLISISRYAETMAFRTSTTSDPDVFYNIQKIVSKAITGFQFDIMSTNFDGAYIPWEEEDGNTGFVRHGITTAKLNPWGRFEKGSPTEVKNFIVDVSHTGIYYILKFNDKVADATACDIWYGGHMSSKEMTTVIDWQESCYECGMVNPSTSKYKAMWGCLSFYSWKTSHSMVTDDGAIRMFKVVSVAAKKAKNHLSDIRIHHLAFDGFWDVTAENASDKSMGPTYTMTTIECLDDTFTKFTFIVGGSKYYINLDAPGLDATQAEVWYKEL